MASNSGMLPSQEYRARAGTVRGQSGASAGLVQGATPGAHDGEAARFDEAAMRVWKGRVGWGGV